MNYIRCNNCHLVKTTFRSSDNTPSIIYTLKKFFIYNYLITIVSLTTKIVSSYEFLILLILVVNP